MILDSMILSAMTLWMGCSLRCLADLLSQQWQLNPCSRLNTAQWRLLDLPGTLLHAQPAISTHKCNPAALGLILVILSYKLLTSHLVLATKNKNLGKMEYSIKTNSSLKELLQNYSSVLGSIQAAFNMISPTSATTLPGSSQHLTPVTCRRQLCESMSCRYQTHC